MADNKNVLFQEYFKNDEVQLKINLKIKKIDICAFQVDDVSKDLVEVSKSEINLEHNRSTQKGDTCKLTLDQQIVTQPNQLIRFDIQIQGDLER